MNILFQILKKTMDYLCSWFFPSVEKKFLTEKNSSTISEALSSKAQIKK